MATLQSKLILSLVDKITAPARGIKRAVSGLQEAQKRNNAAIARSQTQMAGAVGVAYALGRSLMAPINSASAFEKQMGNVATLLDTNKESMTGMGNEVRAIARRTPVALADLTDSLYDVRSAGIAAKDAMGVLEGSARLAVAGKGTTKQATDLVTSSINAFNLGAKEQAELYDQIFTAVKNGKTDIAQLSQGFGAVAGTVASANIKIDDYLASVAALTTTGLPAAQAHTQIRAAISGLTRETKLSSKIFKKLGAKDFKDLVKRSGSVVEAFKKIKGETKDDAELLKLVGSVEAYNAILGLTGQQNEAYVNTLKDMRDGVSSVDEAFEKQSKTNAALRQTFKTLLEDVSISIGNALLPAINSLMQMVTPMINRIRDFAEANPQLTATIVGLTAGLVALRIAAIAAQFSFLWMKGGFLSAAIVSLKGIGLAATIAGGGLKALVAVGLFPFKAIIGGAKAARLALIRFRISAMLVGVGPAILAATASGAKGLLSLLRPMALVRGALRLLKLAVIGTGVGAILVAIATAGALIYENWSGIKAMFVAFGNAFMEALGPAKPIIDPIIDGFKLLKKAWDSFAGPFTASDKTWAEFGASAGRAVGKVVKWFAELPGRIATAIGEIDLSDFVSWPEPPGWWKKLFGGDEEKKPVSTPKPEAVDSSKLTNSPVIPDEAAAQKAKANIDNMVGAVKQGADAATAEARIAGAHIQEGLGVTATPKVDTAEIERALLLTNQLKSSIRSVGNTSVNSGIAGARAAGGNVVGGKTYLVGEEGPELVTMNRSGYVHNAADTEQMLAGGGSQPAGSPNASAGGAVQAQSGGLRDVHVHVHSVSDKNELYDYVKTQLAQDVQGELSGAQGDTDWSVG